MSSNQVLIPLVNDGQRVVDLNLDSKTRVIYFLKSIQNRKIKFSTRVRLPQSVDAKEMSAAIKRAQRFANAELFRRLGKKKSRVTPLIRDELELWLKVKAAEGWSYDTMNNIKRAKLQIAEFWGDRFPHEITRDNLAEWYGAFKAAHPDIRMENAIKYMRNFCGYLAEKTQGDVPLLPAVPKIKDPEYNEIRAERQKKKENIFSDADLRKIIKSAASEDDQLIVLIMYTMATRITETLTMKFGDQVLLDKKVPSYRWQVGQNKADLWGEHSLHSILLPRLIKLRDLRKEQKTKLLFPQLHNNQAALGGQQIDWDGWRKRADIGWHWTPHTFRHTCLSNLFNDEKNPQAIICKLYRVSLAVAMETYIKVTDSGREKMREAIRVDI